MADSLASLIAAQKEVVAEIGRISDSIVMLEDQIKKTAKTDPNHPGIGQWKSAIKDDTKRSAKFEAKLKKINETIKAVQVKIAKARGEKKEVEATIKGLGESIKQHQKSLKSVKKDHPAYGQWTKSIADDEKNMKKETAKLKKINDVIGKLEGAL